MPKVAPTRSAEPDALLFALSEQAVVDAKFLQERGLIRDGRAITYAEWPRTRKRALRRYGAFLKPCHVIELVHFFTHGHFSRMLEAAGSTIDPDAALSRLGFREVA